MFYSVIMNNSNNIVIYDNCDKCQNMLKMLHNMQLLPCFTRINRSQQRISDSMARFGHPYMIFNGRHLKCNDIFAWLESINSRRTIQNDNGPIGFSQDEMNSISDNFTSVNEGQDMIQMYSKC